MKFLKVKNNKSWLLIGMIAVVVSLAPILELWHTNSVYSGADMQFHINRVYEIINHIKDWNFSLISIETFNAVGSGVQYFYPNLTLFPAVIVFLLIKNTITAYYVSLFFYGLITFFIAEFSFSKLLKNIWLSTFGSIIFSLATYRVFSVIGVSAFGEFIAISLLPLVLLGYYRIVNREGWRTLWLSLVLISYTHLLSLALTVVVLFAITLIRFIMNYKQTVDEIPYYFKAGVGFLFTFFAFLVPFLWLTKQNLILSPTAALHYQWSETFAGYFVSSSRLLFTRTLGFSFVILLIGLFVNWYKLAKNTRIIFWLGILIIFIASSDFPWFKLEHTAVATLQFPYRFVPFAIILLTFSGLLAMQDVAKVTKNNNAIKYVVILLSVITIVSTIMGVHGYKKQLDTTYKLEKINYGHLNYTPFAAYRVTESTFDKQINNHFDTYGAFDYWTQEAVRNKKTITAHQILDDNKNRISSNMKLTRSSITYNINNTKEQNLDLPFLKYKGIPYQVTVNNRDVSSSMSKRGTLLVPVKKGLSTIEVRPKVSFIMIIAYTISLISIIIVIVTIPKQKNNK